MKKEAVEVIVDGLKQAGINFISLLPDSDFIEAQQAVMEDKSFACVPVSNLAIGVGVCAGAWLGGKKPALLITAEAILAGALPVGGIEHAKEHTGDGDTVSRCVRHGVWFMTHSI